MHFLISQHPDVKAETISNSWSWSNLLKLLNRIKLILGKKVSQTHGIKHVYFSKVKTSNFATNDNLCFRIGLRGVFNVVKIKKNKVIDVFKNYYEGVLSEMKKWIR